MDLQARLRAAMRRGNLTVSDLARWLDRPRATVATWVHEGREVAGGPIDQFDVQTRLSRLEKLIRDRKGLPIPRMSPARRVEYLRGLESKYANG